MVTVQQPHNQAYGWGDGSPRAPFQSIAASQRTGDESTSGVRDFRETDLRAVVAIDQAALKGFMLTRLGKGFTAQYYSLLARYPRSIFLVAEGYGGLLGFAAGYVWPSEFYGHVAANNHKLTFAAIPALLRRPFAASSLAGGTKTADDQAWADAPIDPARSELASIAVLPQCTRRGVGRRLINAFAQRALQMGAAEIRLTTTADYHDTPNCFFRSVGFGLAQVLGAGTKHSAHEYRLALLDA